MPGMQMISKSEIDLILNNLKKLKSYYIKSPPLTQRNANETYLH